MRVRNGKIRKTDWEKSKTHNPQILTKANDYDDIIHLFYRNEDVHKYNLKKLKELHQKDLPIAKIVADHKADKKAQKIDPKEAWGLNHFVYMAQNAEVMLRINLLQKFWFSKWFSRNCC